MCGVVSVSGEGQDPNSNKISVELTSTVAGKYIWRGQNLSDDPVFQPGLNIGYGNMTVGFWGNMDMSNINGNSGDMSELDYTLDYSDDFAFANMEWLGYSVGVLYYDFPGTTFKDTTEVYGGLSLAVPLNPSVTVYHDVDEADGSYVCLAAEHSIEKIVDLGPLPIGLDLGANLGWGSGSYDKYYWGTDQSKMQDLTFCVCFPTEIIGFDVSVSMNYVMLLSDDIRDMDTYGTASDFFFAVFSVAKSF